MTAAERAALLHETFPNTGVVDKNRLLANAMDLKLATKRRGWLVRRALLLADLSGLSLAFVLAGTVAAGSRELTRVAPEWEFALFFLLSLPAWVVIAKIYGLYDHDEERTDHSTVDEFVSVFHLVTVGAWLLYAVTFVTGVAQPHPLRLVVFWAFAVASVALLRASARAYCRRQVTYLQNTVIVGAGSVGQLVATKLLHHPEYGINLVGFVDDAPVPRKPELDHVALLGSPERLPQIVELLDVERVIIAFSNDSHELTLDLVRSLKSQDVQIDIVPRLFEVLGPSVGIHTVEGLPLLGLPPLRLSRSSALLKRTMDVVVAGIGVLVLAPFLALIALLIKLDSAGPVFFRQVRMGAGEETFRIFKFRTMAVDAEERKRDLAHLNIHRLADPRMFKVADDPRTTRVGRFLRRYSIDELPQLFNVLRGDMSLVGPRPLVLDEDHHVREWARERLLLKPGITGPWQVLGGSGIPFDEMIKLDYLYVTGWSLYTDIQLVLRTIPAVFRVREAY